MAFAKELRELTAYRVTEGVLVEFASRLRSNGGKVKVDGDPQHAGFQFRASGEVAEKTKNQTYYLGPTVPTSPVQPGTGTARSRIGTPTCRGTR